MGKSGLKRYAPSHCRAHRLFLHHIQYDLLPVVEQGVEVRIDLDQLRGERICGSVQLVRVALREEKKTYVEERMSNGEPSDLCLWRSTGAAAGFSLMRCCSAGLTMARHCVFAALYFAILSAFDFFSSSLSFTEPSSRLTPCIVVAVRVGGR